MDGGIGKLFPLIELLLPWKVLAFAADDFRCVNSLLRNLWILEHF